MAQTNPFGTVALGQEGSGLAQILKPYDAAKYDEALIAQKQKEKEDEQKALREVKKDFKLGDMEEVDTGWLNDQKYYSNQFNELIGEEKSLFEDAVRVRQINDYNEFLNQSDELVARWADHNKKVKDFNKSINYSIQNKDIYEKADAYARSNELTVDGVLMEKRKREFVNPPEELMKRANNDIQLARQMYLDEYCLGEFVPQKLNHTVFQKDIRSLTQQSAEKKAGGAVTWTDNYGGSGIGGFVKSDGSRVLFTDEEQKAIVLANIANHRTALDYFRNSPELETPLKAYAKENGTTVDKLSYRQMWDFMNTNDDAMTFMKNNFFWKDEVKSNQSFSQASDGYGGAGAEIQTSINDGKKQVKTKGNVFLEIVDKWGAENIKPQVSTNALVTTNMGGKYIRKSGSTWKPSTRAISEIKGENAPTTPQRLKSTSIEANTIVVAKDDIQVNVGGKQITIQKGSSPPQELLDNKQFVSENYNKLDYQIWSTAIFTDDATKLDNPISAPIEDMKTLYTDEGYNEAINRNKIVFNADGTVLYYSDNNEQTTPSNDTENKGTSGIEWEQINK